MNRVFEINYERLVLLLLPTFLRRSSLYSFIYVMITPLVGLYDLLVVHRKDSLYRLQMNGQVCYLRRILNDAFPVANGSIRVEDSATKGRWLFAYDTGQGDALQITDEGVPVYDRSTIPDHGADFLVIVPQSLYTADNDVRIRSIVNKYKLLSKSYTIIYE